jgi:hypothetical protein
MIVGMKNVHWKEARRGIGRTTQHFLRFFPWLRSIDGTSAAEVHWKKRGSTAALRG